MGASACPDVRAWRPGRLNAGSCPSLMVAAIEILSISPSGNAGHGDDSSRCGGENSLFSATRRGPPLPTFRIRPSILERSLLAEPGDRRLRQSPDIDFSRTCYSHNVQGH